MRSRSGSARPCSWSRRPTILARLLADALYGGLSGHAAAGDGLRIALLAVGRGVLGWAWEACTEAAARRARAATRRRALATAIGLAASGRFARR